MGTVRSNLKSVRSTRGITLLEVMFSIGVAVVGLLGVMALLPMAAFQAQQGLIADRASQVGLNAIDNFNIRGMRQPEMWVRWMPANSALSRPAGWVYFRSPGETPVWDTVGDVTYAPPFSELTSICIDPRFVAHAEPGPDREWGRAGIDDDGNGIRDDKSEAGWSGSDDLFPNQNDQGNDFPYVTPAGAGPAILKIPRCTLRTAHGVFSPMGPVLAEQVFASDDDLAFNTPDDASLLPRQRYTVLGPGADGQPGIAGIDDDGNGAIDDAAELGWRGSDDVRTQRQFDGNFTWMATLAPKLDSTGTFRNLYTLSVVVFHQRGSSDMDEFNERVANVVFWNGGYGGGEVTLSTYDVNRPAEDLELTGRQWIMLLANSISGTTASGLTPTVRWYRVLSTDDDPTRWTYGADNNWGISGVDDDSNGVTDDPREAGWPGSDDQPSRTGTPFVYTRNATLHGADWSRPEWHPPGSVYYPTQAVLMSGVVAVFERTIRLEESSAWTQ